MDEGYITMALDLYYPLMKKIIPFHPWNDEVLVHVTSPYCITLAHFLMLFVHKRSEHVHTHQREGKVIKSY
jgi:hypothetical protein